MSNEYTMTVENAEGEEVEVTIEYSYYAGCPGMKEAGTGLALEPDDPEEVEIEGVKDSEGIDYELTEEDTEVFYEKIFEHIKNEIEEAKAEAAIARYEARYGY
jgi:hypothetical protein